ncbi:MAG TPA: GNAT family N-acetyltransferase [Holophaga sp.]|nr:GNAT family N-acetyltransferase [Holophaga sp.]
MRLLEELAANACPGMRWVLVDGWAVRFADGYTRRANSVLPLYPGRACRLDERIARCEALMAREGLAPTFKLFPEAEPPSLDLELERRGYERRAETAVMVLDGIAGKLPASPAGFRFSVAQEVREPWFGLYAENGGLDARRQAAARVLMANIEPEKRFLALEGPDGIAGTALVVIEHGWAGIFDVVVRKDLRGRGLGRLLMQRVLAEAAAEGAERSYLQVMAENTTAVGLYRSLGYRVAYPYWYRVKEPRA